MRLSLINGIALSMALYLGSTYAFGQDARAQTRGTPTAASSSASSSPDDFLRTYYQAMSKAKGPQDIEPYMSREVKSKMKAGPDDAELASLFAEMIQSTHPIDVKIVSKKVEGDKVIYDLLPNKIPPACADIAKEPTFSMKGSAIVVKQDGEWKIYKDHWVAESKGKDGNFRMSFGTDPDAKDKEPALPPEASPEMSKAADYSSALRDHLVNKWKQAGTGKEIYITMKISPTGSVSDLTIGGASPQQPAEDQLRELIMSAQPLPALPEEMADKPYVWMMLDWEVDKGRCISGPYFHDKLPDWVMEKMAKKAPTTVQ